MIDGNCACYLSSVGHQDGGYIERREDHLSNIMTVDRKGSATTVSKGACYTVWIVESDYARDIPRFKRCPLPMLNDLSVFYGITVP